METGVFHPLAGLWRRQGDGILIKSAAAHHITGGRIPRIVFEEGEDAAGAQGLENVIQRCLSLAGGDVVEHPVGEGEIEGIAVRLCDKFEVGVRPCKGIVCDAQGFG